MRRVSRRRCARFFKRALKRVESASHASRRRFAPSQHEALPLDNKKFLILRSSPEGCVSKEEEPPKGFLRTQLNRRRSPRFAPGHPFGETGRHSRAAPRAPGDADTAAVVFDEVPNAFVEIDVPLAPATHRLFLGMDGAGGTGLCAYLAVCAEIVGTEHVRGIRDERHVRHDAGQPESRAQLAVDHRAMFAQFTQPGGDGGRNYEDRPGIGPAMRFGIPAMLALQSASL